MQKRHKAENRVVRSGREGRVLLKDRRALSFMEFGDPAGLPILGFHGTPGSRFMFRLGHAPALKLGLRLIAPERPGYGLSAFQKDRTLAGWASDMAQFCDALEIGRFAVAGVSGGGPYAAACAALLPQRVLAAGLISPVGPVTGPGCPEKIGFAHYCTFKLFPDLPLIMPGIFGLGRLAFLYAPQLVFGFIMGRAAPADWKILTRKEVRRNLLEGVTEGVRPGVRGGLAEMRIFARPWNIPFQDITAPCFLWQGTADRNVPPAAAFQLGKLIPGCRVFELQGAGHYWIFDRLEEVLGTIAAAAKAHGPLLELQVGGHGDG